jgi:hypothetical protein
MVERKGVYMWLEWRVFVNNFGAGHEACWPEAGDTGAVVQALETASSGESGYVYGANGCS